MGESAAHNEQQQEFLQQRAESLMQAVGEEQAACRHAETQVRLWSQNRARDESRLQYSSKEVLSWTEQEERVAAMITAVMESIASNQQLLQQARMPLKKRWHIRSTSKKRQQRLRGKSGAG